MSFKEFWLGNRAREGKIKSIPNYNAGQTNILDQIQKQIPLGSGLNFLRDRLSDNPDAFERIFAPSREHFKRITAPGISERLTSIGGEGRSGAYAQTLGEAARGLERDIFADKERLKGDSFNQMLQLLMTALSPRQSHYAQPAREATPGFFHQGAEAALKIATMLPFLI